MNCEWFIFGIINWLFGIMKKNIIKEKSFEFALLIINYYKHLSDKKNEYVLSKQLLRSGTSIGAMVCESEHAESKADFIHKLSIAQKEANETAYWIELLYKSEFIDKDKYELKFCKMLEIKKNLSAILISSKSSKSKQ